MGAHAKLQPSAAKRWLNCPGSITLCENVVDDGGKYAEEGTACHEICENVLNGKAWPEPGSKASNGVEVTEEMLGYCRTAVEWVLDYLDITGAVLHTEVRVEIGAAFGLPEGLFFGTADVVAISKAERLVLDFKFGYNAVAVEEIEDGKRKPNPQLFSYDRGGARKFGPAPSTRLVIMQPKCGPEPTEAVFSAAEMQAHHEEMAPKIVQASKGGALVAGSWCADSYCRARAVCPAFKDEMVAIMQREWANPLTHTPEELAELLTKLEFVESAGSALRAHVMKLIELGGKVPGWKIVRGDTKRKWLGEDKATADGLKKMGVDPWEKKLISPAGAEAVLVDTLTGASGKKRLGFEGSTKKAAKEFAKDLLKAFAGKPEGKPLLVPATDPRPALPPVFTAEDVKLLDAASAKSVEVID